MSAAGIGCKVGHIIQRFQVAKHFETVIAEGLLKATVRDWTGFLRRRLRAWLRKREKRPRIRALSR
ncbi:MAG: hypothetical protein ACRER2_10320 [Methylococcales bacterium]